MGLTGNQEFTAIKSAAIRLESGEPENLEPRRWKLSGEVHILSSEWKSYYRLLLPVLRKSAGSTNLPLSELGGCNRFEDSVPLVG